jgi:hypothetical protein
MTDESIRELVRLRDRAVLIVDSDASWETKFNLVFSDDLSLRVWELDSGFDYYDPDTTYEDDVRAFVEALQERVADLEKILG